MVSRATRPGFHALWVGWLRHRFLLDQGRAAGEDLMVRNWLLLEPLGRLTDLGLFLMRLLTGAFLVYQSHDNIFSSDRMLEFEKFLAGFNFWRPDLMAPLSVWFQFLCGIAFILGLFTRWAGLITAIIFAVAVWMVHWPQDFPGWWPALVLLFLGLLFGTAGAGRYSVDEMILNRSRHGRPPQSPPWT
jgi:putative oxidoreductase